MAEKAAKVGVKKEAGYLYFVDKKGNVARAKMSRGGRKKGKAKIEVVAKVGVCNKGVAIINTSNTTTWIMLACVAVADETTVGNNWIAVLPTPHASPV